MKHYFRALAIITVLVFSFILWNNGNPLISALFLLPVGIAIPAEFMAFIEE